MMHGDSLAAGIAMISRSTSSRSGQDRRLLLVRTCDVLNTPRNDVSAQNTFDDSRYVSFSTYINTRACRFYSQARLRFEAFQEQITILRTLNVSQDCDWNCDLTRCRRKANLIAATLVIKSRLYLSFSLCLIWRNRHRKPDNRTVFVDPELVI